VSAARLLNDSKRGLSATLFDAKALGLSLRLVSAETLQSGESELEGLWYQGGAGVGFLIWKDSGGKILRQQMFFHHLVAEWDIVNGIRTGSYQSEVRGRVDYDDKPHAFVVEQAWQIGQYLSGLGDTDKKQSLRLWKSGSFWSRFWLALLGKLYR